MDASLHAEIAELRARLDEAEEMLRAIRAGEVDALVVEGDAGPQVFTLQGLDAEQYRLRGEMLAQVSDAVIAVDRDERMTFLNAAAERQYGIRASDVLGRQTSDLYSPVWPDADAEAAMRMALRDRGEWRGELRHRTRMGRELWVEATVTLLRGLDGASAGVVTAIRDVTERKRSDDARRESQERVRLAAEAAQLGFWSWQPDDDKVVWENEYPYRILGLPPASPPVTVARFATEFLHPDDRAAFEQAVARTVQAREPFAFTGRIRRPDGETRWFEFAGTPQFPEGERGSRILGTVQDVTERRLAEEALHQNATLFSTLIAQAPMGTYVVDAQFRMRQVNTEAMPVFASVQPLIGRDFREALDILWGPELGREIADIFRRTLDTGERYVSPPFTERRHDLGIEQSYEWQTQRVMLPDGQFGVVCYFHEVTERAQAVAALRASAERLRLAAEATGIGVWEWHLRTNRIKWDAQMFRLYGMAPTADGFVRYSDWSGAVLPEDLATNEAILQETVRQRGRSHRTFRIQRREDGACRHIDAVEIVRTNAADEPEWVLGTNLDVTGRVEQETALAESEVRFRSMADQTPIPMWVTDAEGGIEFVNRAYCAFFGVTLDQVRRTKWAPLVHPEDSAGVTAFADALAAHRPIQGTARVRRADGGWRWIHSVTQPRYADGEYAGMIGISRDVTEERRASEFEREAALQKDEFIAVLAHELRNPLAPIRTSVGVLRALGPIHPRVVQCRDIIDRQVTQMARLLDDLLDVSRLSQGKLTLQRATVRLRDVIDAAVETVRPVIDEREHTLTVDPINPALVLDADAARLTQVLTNLLTNAAKYTNPHGGIAVTVEADTDHVAIRVRDNGIGIRAEMHERVFDLFTQVEDAQHRADGGLGIGLGLTKRLVELHGGTIQAESEGPGHGSTFTVTLPLDARTRRSSHSPGLDGSAAPEPPVRRRVVVVDDNRDAADTLAMLLESIGCEVRTAYDGAEALRVAADFRPDLMLLDLGMPGLDGRTVCHRLRAEAWGTGVVIAAVTGWGQDEDRRRTRAAGFDHHLVKPVDPALLTDLVRQVRHVPPAPRSEQS